MPALRLQVGAYLLVRPEDVEGAVTRAYYATVTRIARTKVTIDPLQPGPSNAPTELKRRNAESRVVPRSEAKGTQPGTWLRSAVWVSIGNSYRNGQVRDYNGSKLKVWTAQGEVAVTRRQIMEEIHPIIALTLGFQAWNKRTWPKSRLLALHASLTSKLSTMETRDANPPSVVEWPDEIKTLATIDHLDAAQVEWMDAVSGAAKTFSLHHALLYVMYSEYGRHTSRHTLSQLGNSMTDEPRSFRAWVGGNTTPNETRSAQPAAINARAFLASLSDEDDSGGEGNTIVVPTQPVYALAPARQVTDSAPASVARPATASLSGDANSVLNAASEIELIQLIREHRPDLLQVYLHRTDIQGSRSNSTTGVRTAVNPAPHKRRKNGFVATADQERVHQVVTSEIHRGKDGEEYMEFLTSSSLPFAFHPGMLSRLYDLGFGCRGLSIGHFGRIGYLDRLRKAARATVDTTDFTLPIPP